MPARTSAKDWRGTPYRPHSLPGAGGGLGVWVDDGCNQGERNKGEGKSKRGAGSSKN